MVCIDRYDSNKVRFTCTKCDIRNLYLEVSDPIGENEVGAIEVECPECHDTNTLLVLKCKDEYMANTLLGKLQNLRERCYGKEVT